MAIDPTVHTQSIVLILWSNLQCAQQDSVRNCISTVFSYQNYYALEYNFSYRL